LNFLERRVGGGVVERDERDGDARALMQILKRDFFRLEIEIAQLVLDAANDLALVLQRLRVRNL